MEYIIGLVAGLVVGFIGCLIIQKTTAANLVAAAKDNAEETKKSANTALETAKEKSEEINRSAQLEADGIIKQAQLEAKDALIKIRDEFEVESKDRRKELQDSEKRLDEREQNLDRKMDMVQKRIDELGRRDEQLGEGERKIQKVREEVKDLRDKQAKKLEAVAGMSRDNAKLQLMQQLQQDLSNERGTLIRRHQDEIKQKCDRQAQKLIIQAMQRYAGECAYEYTTATIPLPSDEMKGRIIGREGRNIRVFEAETGVNVLIDDTPSAVVITCFDPVRREIARIALERLVADGRIHPTRVEEVVAKTRADIDQEVIKAGEDALHDLQLTNVAPAVIKLLGRLRFRYSYTQNVLSHSIEVGHFMGMIAAELGLDVEKAKRMGLFHDIGKALTHEVEGTHAIIGMEFLKKHGEGPEVINGVGCHHDEIPAESVLASMVAICDAMSASRPGARCETTDLYVKRLEELEQIGTEFEGVESCYAVQAGREIRITVDTEQVNEKKAAALARDIAGRIEAEMQFPGQIKVCVVRETRAIEYAK